MPEVNTEQTTRLVTALNAKFENKQANKKNDISGDFSDDNVSYPTVQAVNNKFDTKVNIADIKDDLISTDSDKPLSANQGKVLKALIDGQDVSVAKLSAANTTSGFAATYELTQNGVRKGLIDIPKDKMLRGASIETVGAEPTELEVENSLETGDSYILFVVNTEDNDGTTNLVIPVNSIFDMQEADGVSITLTNGVYSVADGYVEGIIDDYIDEITTALNQ